MALTGEMKWKIEIKKVQQSYPNVHEASPAIYPIAILAHADWVTSANLTISSLLLPAIAALGLIPALAASTNTANHNEAH